MTTTAGIDRLLSLPAAKRRRIISNLNPAERTALFKAIEFRKSNPWMKYQGDPIGFIHDALGEELWSKQAEVMQSLVDNKRTTVPTSHAIGKTHIAARAVAYWATVYPPGTSKIVTTSTTFRQVESILWPHIRRLQKQHGLPGYTTATKWRIGDPPEAVAEGFKPPDDDEAATQGYHAPNMLIIVDEAGGIDKRFGRSLESLMTGGNTRMLVLGNPPVDEEGTWFESTTTSPLYNVIPIAAYDTPNFTGEKTMVCKSCPEGVPPHEIATHLVDEDWVNGLRIEFGDDSPFWKARVLAQFPRDNTAKTLPMGWLELARQNVIDEPGRIKLGVDIASGGGDEFAIAKLDGWKATVVFHRSGPENEDAMDVAGKIFEHIREAEVLHEERGIKQRVQVKIDSIGVGWGIVGLLQQWERERRFKAHIVGVNVAERAGDNEKFMNQRAELWWNTRQLIQPNEKGEQTLYLDIKDSDMAQLNAPLYKTDSSGRIVIESKPDMKKRGISSPDRAESILLAVFEPPGEREVSKPVALTQQNEWSAWGAL